MNVSCIECSSPDLPQLTERLSTLEGIESAADFANGLFDVATDLLGSDFFTLSIDRMLADSRSKCPHHPEYQPSASEREYEPFEEIKREDSLQFLIALGIATVCSIVAVSLFLGTVRVVVRRRHRKWLDSLTDHRVIQLWQHQEKEKELDAKLNEATTSLFLSPEIPKFVRVLVPIVLLGNIGLFLSGHLSPAVSVNGLVSIAGDTYREESFFEFSIATGTVNLWIAGGRELAILILLFSGVWPYMKQLISLALWFLPPRILSSHKRGQIYLWLDFLAKWSMVDIFTLLIILVAFRVTVER
jgi:hypothetical protein